MSKLTLTDDAGNTEEIALPADVTLIIKPPAPVSPPPPPPTSLVADFKIVRVTGLAVAVQDLSTVVGGKITSIHYDFAPNVWASGNPGGNASATMPGSGTYPIKQTVKDSNGHTSTATHNVTVPAPAAEKPVDPPAAPPAPPETAFTTTVDGATVTVHDQTTGATSESIDFGDGTVMDDAKQ